MDHRMGGARTGLGFVTIMGAILTIEGVVVGLFSRQVTVDSLGTFEWNWILLVGITVAILGIAMVVGARRWARSKGEDAHTFWAAAGSCTVVIAIAAFLLAFSSPMVIEGIGSVQGFWMALAGAEFLFIGLSSLLIMLTSRYARRPLGGTAPVQIVFASCLVAEGAAISAAAAPIDVSGSLVAESFYVILAGIQLMLIALMLALLPLVWSRRPAGSNLDMVGASLCMLLTLEGLAVIVLAAPVTLGSYRISTGIMVMAGVQLTVLAAVILLLLAFSPMARAKLQNFAFVASLATMFAMPVLAVLAHL